VRRASAVEVQSAPAISPSLFYLTRRKHTWANNFRFWIGERRWLKTLLPKFKIDEALIQNPKSKIQNAFYVDVRYTLSYHLSDSERLQFQFARYR
jgi:hypothetical protein